MFANLRAEMKRYGKTNADIGKILNLSTNSVSFKLNGRTPFTLDEIRKLAEEFNCSLDYLAAKGNRSTHCAVDAGG